MNKVTDLYIEDFIGQEKIIDIVEKEMFKALYTASEFSHTLLSGPPGTGKTMLARIIANELTRDIYELPGPHIKTEENVYDALTHLDVWSIFFIDEIHGIGKEAELILDTVVQDFVWQGQAIFPFTLIGATTSPGSLTKALRDRLKLHLEMDRYKLKDIEKIVEMDLCKREIDYEIQIVNEIALRSRMIPRIAKQIIDFTDTERIYGEEKTFKISHLSVAMDDHQIDPLGLTNNDRKYLKFLNEAGVPIGERTLIKALDVDKEDIRNIIEPFLIRSGFVQVTSRGRILTPKGVRYVQ